MPQPTINYRARASIESRAHAQLWFKAKTANTGASTLNVNGLGAQPLIGGAHSALQGGEMVANGKASAIWRADISSFVLLECTGGALQVAPGTQSNHAA